MDRMTSLLVFTAAVEGGSLAAAARRHKMTPAMAGRHLGNLEQTLGARLLQRTTRRLHLTDVGQTFYQRCRRILDEFDEAQREATELQSSPRGTLRVAVPALQGEGIAYGPSFVFGEALYRGDLVRVLPRYSAADLGIHAVVPSSRYLSTKVRHLIDLLASEFGENPPWDGWREAESGKAHRPA